MVSTRLIWFKALKVHQQGGDKVGSNNINVKDGAGAPFIIPYSISAPEPKKNLHWLRFPFFSDKVIDLTESFGKVTYYPREIQFTLEKLRPKDAWLDAYNSFWQPIMVRVFD